VHEDGMVHLSGCVAESGECPAEINVPDMAPLLGAVDPLFEPEDVAIRDVKTGGCFHIDLLVEVSVEVGSLDVHLVNFQVMLGGEHKYSVE